MYFSASLRNLTKTTAAATTITASCRSPILLLPLKQQQRRQQHASAKNNKMYCTGEFCIIPIGVGPSVSKYVAACDGVLKESGIKYQMHAEGTNVEGEWGEIMAVIEKCVQTMVDMGAIRVSTSIKIGTRTDKQSTLATKMEAVDAHLSGQNSA
ncbi:hypothetical protein GQ42DRAFT_162269 [Ramicandelaber brevisporus]|nr:hypothetical protein GQ42DRAFT_162269 [Ramicandelaber brevisporus]